MSLEAEGLTFMRRTGSCIPSASFLKFTNYKEKTMTEQQKKETSKYEKYAVCGGMTISFKKKNGLPFPYSLETGKISTGELALYAKMMIGSPVWYRDKDAAEKYTIKDVRIGMMANVLVFDIARKVDQNSQESIGHEDVPFPQLFSTKELCEKDWEETQQTLLSVSRMNIQLHMLRAEMPALFNLPSGMPGSGWEGDAPGC